MLLSGRGTTRIKRGHRVWPNHTPRSMSIQWDTVLFGRMGSPNIYSIQHKTVNNIKWHMLDPRAHSNRNLRFGPNTLRGNELQWQGCARICTCLRRLCMPRTPRACGAWLSSLGRIEQVLSYGFQGTIAIDIEMVASFP